jgi:hypothetical protein
MASLTTARVGLNQQTLVPGPVVGAAADQVLIINLDLDNTVNLGSSSTNLSFPLGPLASATLTAPVFAAAATVPLQVGIAPGGSSYSPGSLTITGPVTAEITGPVEISDIEGGTVTFTNDMINIIGTGGYVTPGQVGALYSNATAFTIAAGATNSTSTYNVTTFTSLDFVFASMANSSAAAGSAMCAVVTLRWNDPTGNSIGTDVIAVCQGQYVTGSLPCRGSLVTIEVQNPGSTGTLTFPIGDININGSFRVIDKLRFNVGGQNPPAFAGLSIQAQPAPAYTINGWLANINQTGLTAGDLYMWLLPMYSGPVVGTFSINTADLDNDAVIIDLAYAVVGGVTAGTGNNGVLQNWSSAIGTEAASYYAPPSQLALVAKPSSSTTSVFLTLTGQA